MVYIKCTKGCKSPLPFYHVYVNYITKGGYIMKQAKERYLIYQTNFINTEINNEIVWYAETHLYNGKLYKSEEEALATCETLRIDGENGLFVAKVLA